MRNNKLALNSTSIPSRRYPTSWLLLSAPVRQSRGSYRPTFLHTFCWGGEREKKGVPFSVVVVGRCLLPNCPSSGGCHSELSLSLTRITHEHELARPERCHDLESVRSQQSVLRLSAPTVEIKVQNERGEGGSQPAHSTTISPPLPSFDLLFRSLLLACSLARSFAGRPAILLP